MNKLTVEELKGWLVDINLAGPISGKAVDIVMQAVDYIEALERENERLRDALARIALQHGAPASGTGGYYEDIAKEALAWEVLA